MDGSGFPDTVSVLSATPFFEIGLFFHTLGFFVFVKHLCNFFR